MKRRRWVTSSRRKKRTSRTYDEFYQIPVTRNETLSNPVCEHPSSERNGTEALGGDDVNGWQDDQELNESEGDIAAVQGEGDVVVGGESEGRVLAVPVLPEEQDEDEDESEDEEGAGGMIPLRWTTLASILTNTGTKRFTEEHYGTFAGYINWVSTQGKLPSLSTAKRNVRPSFCSLAFLSTDTRMFPVDFTKSGAKPGVRRHLSENECPVTIVKPSDWAKADLATDCIRDLVTRSSSRDQDREGEAMRPVFSCIEDAPLVRNRLSRVEAIRIEGEGKGFRELTPGLCLHVDARNSFNCRREMSRAGFQSHVEGHNLRITADVVSFHISDIVDEDIMARNAEGLGANSNTTRRRRRKGARLQDSPPFRVGDIVVDLKPVPDSEHSDTERGDGTPPCNGYLVFRCWIREKMQSEFRTSIVFLESGCTPQSWDTNSTFDRELVPKVVAVSCEGDIGESGDPLESRVTGEPLGVLSDGRNYVVYRFLLYCDGFTPKQGCSRSMAGCYMHPLGIMLDDRTPIGAIRRLALTPSGVLTNEVIKFVVDDIVQGTVEGFPMQDSKGDEMVLFLDCVGSIGDYPAVSETTDVLGHASHVPCHLCFFSRYDKSGGGESVYGYSTEIHCGHPSFCRNEARLRALRQVDIPDKESKGLGMDSSDSYHANVNALHELCKALSDARGNVPLCRNGKPVVSSVFDTYRSSIIAPDHLFLGLAMDVLNCALKHLPPDIRKDVEVYAKDAPREGDLIYQNHLINAEGTSVNSMQMSAMYSFLLVAPHSFRTAWNRGLTAGRVRMTIANQDKVESALLLLEQFQKLVNQY